MSTVFEAYITNLGKYAEGQLVGETLKFPATTEEVQSLLKNIGVDGVRYEEFFITAFDGDVMGLYDYLTEYENLDELNHLAHLISELDSDEIETLEAALNKGDHTFSVADMHNLKQMAATLNVYQEYGFTSPEQLEAAVDTAYQEMRQTSGELKALETKLQGKKELQQQVLAYAKTKPARDGLKAQKSEKARAAYRQAHESDFIIADAAARYFREHGITKLPARKALQDEIEQLVSKKSSLYNTYHEQKQRYAELQTVKRNIDQILRREEPRRRKEQSHER